MKEKALEGPSLEKIENDFWGVAPKDSSYLISTVHRLRSKPVDLLETEDLRIMIGQDIGLEVLIPLALQRLMRDPLAEGDYYPGDLLVAVLRASREYWKSHTEQRHAIEHIIDSLEEPDSVLRGAVTDFISSAK
jgi:hypothetical protein